MPSRPQMSILCSGRFVGDHQMLWGMRSDNTEPIVYHSSSGIVTVRERKELQLAGPALSNPLLVHRWRWLPLPSTHCHRFNNGLLNFAMINMWSLKSDKYSLMTGLFLNKYLLGCRGLGIYLLSLTFSNIILRWPTTVSPYCSQIFWGPWSMLYLAKGFEQPQQVCPPTALPTLSSVLF